MSFKQWIDYAVKYFTKLIGISASDGTETFIVLQNGEFRQATVNQVKALFDDAEYTKTTFTANGTISVPAGYVIDGIVMENTTANAVTGGIRIGTSAAGTQVVTAQAVGANALFKLTDAALTLKVFSMSVAQSLFVEAVTAWNSASVNVYVKLKKL